MALTTSEKKSPQANGWVILLTTMLVSGWGASIAYPYMVILPTIANHVISNDRMRESEDKKIENRINFIEEKFLQIVSDLKDKNSEENKKILSQLVRLEVVIEGRENVSGKVGHYDAN